MSRADIKDAYIAGFVKFATLSNQPRLLDVIIDYDR
jgi:hypothetical protein